MLASRRDELSAQVLGLQQLAKQAQVVADSRKADLQNLDLMARSLGYVFCALFSVCGVKDRNAFGGACISGSRVGFITLVRQELGRRGRLCPWQGSLAGRPAT